MVRVDNMVWDRLEATYREWIVRYVKCDLVERVQDSKWKNCKQTIPVSKQKGVAQYRTSRE